MKPILFYIPPPAWWIMAVIIAITGLVLFFLYKKRKVKQGDIIFTLIFITGILLGLRKFGPFPVRTYGVAVLTGLIAGTFILHKLLKREGINPEFIPDFVFWIIVGVILGARLFYAIFYEPEYFLENPLRIFYVWEGGLVFYGGAAGGIIAGYAFLKKKKLPIIKIADAAGIAVLAGLGFGRWGCFGYGCCFGKITNSPIGIRFPAHGAPGITSPAFEYHLKLGLVSPTDKFSLPVYPTQIISSINAFILAFILYLLFRKKKFDGQIASLSLIFYGITRFLIEFLRVNPQFLGLTVSQWLSIFFIIYGIILYRKYYIKWNKKIS